MEEKHISFETSKLANKKGFDIDCEYVYRTEDDSEFALYNVWENKRLTGLVELKAPTQSLLQKWLREKYNIHIEVDPDYRCKVSRRDANHYDIITVKTSEGKINFISYEEALEEGLKEALKLI